MRIVVVEDDPDLQDLYRISFQRAGMDLVAVARDGTEGVDAVLEHRPDLTLMDLSMPNMDGLEAIFAIRRADPQRRIAVVSGFEANRMQPVCERVGVVGYIEKGLGYADFIAAIQAAAKAPVPPFVDATGPELDTLRKRIDRLI